MFFLSEFAKGLSLLKSRCEYAFQARCHHHEWLTFHQKKINDEGKKRQLHMS